MLKITTILLLTFILRIYGINWDQGTHLHPDERMLMMVADRLHFFDKLNPDFFNYGSLPIYLLRGLAQIIDALFSVHLGNYDGMLSLGRLLSTSIDVLTAYFVYLIAKLIFKNKKIALLSAFFYSISFFAIQNAHFFIVDTFLTFFVTALLYCLLLYLQQSTLKKILLLAIVSAAAITTKFTAIVFIPVVVLTIIFKEFKQFKRLIFQLFLFSFSLLIFSFIFMPYAYLDWHKFLADVLLQIKLNSDPYVFPYTLQYVGTIPYLYYLKNVFLWGLGPPITILAFIGIFFLIKHPRATRYTLYATCYYVFYFLIIGRSAVKFMRYMLPIYPFLALMAGYGLWKITNNKIARSVFLIACLLWTALFLNIYSHEHTRISATKWIKQNIPSGSTLAVEHWDDALPLSGGEKYKYVEMTLYDQPDDEQKWLVLNEKLKQTDYIILSSNRLYVPLQKLNDCQKFKICYPKTAEYYGKLFNGQLGFQKVAEFTVYPGFKIGSLRFEIPDDSADESFTVYDHPKVIIFKKE